MWPTIRFAATRQLRVCGAAGLASRVVVARQAPVALPASFRFQLSRRAFSESARLLKSAAASGTTGAAKAKPKKRVVSKKGTKKVASKRTATKKAGAAKKKRAKKPLSDEDRVKGKRRDLKKLVLKEPPSLPTAAWLVYIKQRLQGANLGRDNFGQTMKDLAEDFKALSGSELERLRDAGEQNKLANDAAYKSWVEGHTPNQIAEANRARRHLKRIDKTFHRRQIKDERQPKRPTSPYLLFVKSRWQSGEFSSSTAVDAAKSIAGEWKALSDAQRQPFVENSKVDHDRYIKERKSVLGG